MVREYDLKEELTRLKPARQTLFKSAPLAASPTFRVNLAILRRAEKLLECVYLHRTPEERPTAGARPAAIVNVLAGLVAADRAHLGPVL